MKRMRKFDHDKAKRMRAGGATLQDIADTYGVTKEAARLVCGAIQPTRTCSYCGRPYHSLYRKHCGAVACLKRARKVPKSRNTGARQERVDRSRVEYKILVEMWVALRPTSEIRAAIGAKNDRAVHRRLFRARLIPEFAAMLRAVDPRRRTIQPGSP